MMRRRELLTLLGASAWLWPFAAAAQQSTMPVIGFLHSGSPEQNVERLAAFRKGLGDPGFVEGTAKALGLEVPTKLLLIADEVVE